MRMPSLNVTFTEVELAAYAPRRQVKKFAAHVCAPGKFSAKPAISRVV
jgi:hypothetical protein